MCGVLGRFSRPASIAGILLCASLLAGCDQTAQMRELGFQGPPAIVPKGEAITKFMSAPEGITSLYVNFDELASSTVGTRDAVTQANFLKLFEAFKNEPVPDNVKSKQREEDRKNFIDALNSLIEGAQKNVSDDELRTLVTPIRPAAEAFMQPANY